MKHNDLRRIISVPALLLLYVSIAYAQNPQWINYTSQATAVTGLVIQGDSVWVGTEKGLARLDRVTGQVTEIYNRANSGLPSILINAISIDAQGNKWIGTYGGLVKYDGTSWTVYNTNNSGLPNNEVTTIAIDSTGNKWIGTVQGLARFDGANWIVYNDSNSALPFNSVTATTIDPSGNIWVGTKWINPPSAG